MISILTCIYAYNYGAVLQAYALQNKIKERGHKCNIINYQPYYAHNRNDFNYLKNKIWKIYKLVDHKRGEKIFEKFIKQKISLTRVYSNNTELINYPPNSKVFIVGSDQVWNFNIESGEDSTFMLDFAPEGAVKCSYAASIAMDNVSCSQKEYLRKYIRDFKHISVRENNAMLLIDNIGRKDVVEVLDPVFLYLKDEWVSFAEITDEDEYILYYAFNSDRKIIEYAYDLKQKTGLRLFVIGTVIKDKKIKSDKFLWELSPEAFVGMFYKARYVVTNSFHGMSFSIIFNKPFKKFNKDGGNSRLDNLIDSLKINTKYIEAIDYTKANTILERKRLESIKFLDVILEEDN